MLYLKRVELDEAYREKWNVGSFQDDFYRIYSDTDNKPVSETLYRVGGFHWKNIGGDKLFKLLKQVESLYREDLRGDDEPKLTLEERRHLADLEVLLNDKGEELCLSNGRISDWICIYGDNIYTHEKRIFRADTNKMICEYNGTILAENKNFIVCETNEGIYRNRPIVVIDKKTCEVKRFV